MTTAATHPFPRKTCNVHGSLPRGGGLGWRQQTNPAATTLIQNNINSSLLWDWNSALPPWGRAGVGLMDRRTVIIQR